MLSSIEYEIRCTDNVARDNASSPRETPSSRQPLQNAAVYPATHYRVDHADLFGQTRWALPVCQGHAQSSTRRRRSSLAPASAPPVAPRTRPMQAAARSAPNRRGRQRSDVDAAFRACDLAGPATWTVTPPSAVTLPSRVVRGAAEPLPSADLFNSARTTSASARVPSTVRETHLRGPDGHLGSSTSTRQNPRESASRRPVAVRTRE